MTTPNYKLTSVFGVIKDKCRNTNNESQRHLFGKEQSGGLNADRDRTLPGVDPKDSPSSQAAPSIVKGMPHSL